ncbi:MAG TPA: 50S ribosomal protein L4 [Microbacteriaceae bacterium]|nr:50S ribosomal protein L4 [Microbacteriaceae bacterium]
MTAIDVFDTKGKKSGSIDLPTEVFDVQTNVPLIHQVVTAQLAAARQGTHKTKTRGEVSGSGAKPFKQKGTGRARQGSIRMPQHRGGGTIHGPQPRDYSQRTPKKMIAAALRGALSDRARAGRLHVVESLSIDEVPSTRTAASLLATHTTGRNVLVVVANAQGPCAKSVRNLPGVSAIAWGQLNAYDVIVSDDLVFTKAAMEAFLAAQAAKQEPVAQDKEVTA